MKINRLRVSAVSAVAVLAIAGAGGAGVASATDPVATDPGVSSGIEATETGIEGEAAVSASDLTGVEVEATEPGATGVEADGIGGHADNPNDPNADHQFEGEE